MREIKFRQYVWDDDSKTNGRMVSWEELLQEENESLGANFTQKFSNASDLMQYTGLKDKNGKEIYEGDIVDNGHTVVYSSSAHQFRYIGIVKFDVKQGCLVIHNTDGNTKRITAKTVQTNKIKVLGNIYDNPELLEVQERLLCK